jgi:hypothetical protein
MNNFNRTEPSTESITADIQATRDSLSQTIQALEMKLQQGDLKGQIEAKIDQVEERAKSLLTEKLGEAKVLIQEELVVAKNAMKEEIGVLETKARQGASDAADRLRSEVYQFKDSIKCDVRDAITDAKQSLRAATVGRVETLASNIGDTMTETKTTILETVRANPIPAAIIGAGIAWMFINRTKSVQMKSRRYAGNFAGEAEGILDEGSGFVEAQISKVAHQAVDAAGNVMRSAGGQINTAAHNVADQAGRLGSTVQTKAKEFAQTASQAGSRIATQAGQVYDRTSSMAKQGMQKVGSSYDTTLQENPLLIAGAAIAFGALLGFSLPRTRREDQLMGSQRDRLLHKAGQSIKDSASSLANMAEDAMENAQRPTKAPARA